MKTECINRFQQVLIEIDKLLATSKDQIIIAIDGKCASGKTTLAYFLESIYECNVFHMDDYFLRKEQKTEERVNETGGNVDYERFKSEVIDKLLRKQEIPYRKYSCKEKQIKPPVRVGPKRLNIIEGSYSMHPYFGDIYDVKVFMDIDEVSQIENIRKRNGEKQLIRFQKEWIPKENAYFNKYINREECVIIDWCRVSNDGIFEKYNQ